eukprot:1190935-Prorocentrum_minimum.AAC.1
MYVGSATPPPHWDLSPYPPCLVCDDRDHAGDIGQTGLENVPQAEITTRSQSLRRCLRVFTSLLVPHLVGDDGDHEGDVGQAGLEDVSEAGGGLAGGPEDVHLVHDLLRFVVVVHQPPVG